MARRLAAILAADVVGFSGLTEKDENGTLAALRAHRSELIEPLVARHAGRIVKLMGDGMLVEFGSVVDAVACAVAFQEGMSARNNAASDGTRMEFRIGVNLGDVVIEGDDIYGDGVNLAARLEALAEPGGICVSGTVREHIAGKLDHAFVDGGEQTVKGLARPVHVWRWSARRAAGSVAIDPPIAAPSSDKPSIAVLPFVNMSGDPAQNYLSDGIAEDIITELARDRGLFVIARNSSFAFRGSADAATMAGARLGVRYVLEGSLRKAGNRIRVTAQLVEASTGRNIWAERYDRDLEDIFAVQDELTASIVAAIPGRIASALVRKSHHRSAQQLDAYDLYLRGRELANQHRSDERPQTKALFEQAAERDPGNARAHAWLADLSIQTWWETRAAKDLAAADNFSNRAVRLDAEDSFCHACRGHVLLFQRNYDGARHHFERAAVLSPNDADIAAMMAVFLMYTGNPQGALERVRWAMRLNPYHPQWYIETLGLCLMNARRYNEAVTIFSNLEEPAYYVHAYLAGCLLALDRRQEAQSHRKRMFELKPDWTPDSFRDDPYRDEADIDHIGGLMRQVAALGD
jgi:adenylate cyclase